MSEMFEDLNPHQKQAVEDTEGPLLIVAGAGSGKTRVLTERIKYLITEKNVFPERIFAVTFTNKAAKEMEKRVGHKLSWMGTFHSICGRILRRHIDKFSDYNNSFVIYDTADQLAVMKAIVKELNIDDKKFRPQALLSQISKAKNENVDWQEYLKEANGDFQRLVGGVYKLYQKTLVKSNALDFDDMLMLCLRLFDENPELLAKYQSQFDYILVDEYQDTNKVQYLLVKRLAGQKRNICVVGDSDQNIYSWRGADIRNILSFEHDFPGAKVIKLEQNYRSTKNILKAANEIIKNNKQRKPKDLWTENSDGNLPRFYHARDGYDEVRFILDEMEKKREEIWEYNSYAIFYRTNAQSRLFEEGLNKLGIPYRLVGGIRFYDRKEVKDIIAYLRLVLNPQDITSLRRVINVPTRGLGDITFAHYEMAAEDNNTSVFELLGKKLPDTKEAGVKAAQNFKDIILKLQQVKKDEPLSELIEQTIKESGYQEMLMKSKYEEDIDHLENIYELLTVAKEKEKEGKSLAVFLEEIALMSDLDKTEEKDDAVTLMTLHSAKGLEFPVVFFSGMEEGLLPHFMSQYKPEQIEEERRLCYVGITRAMKYVFMTAAKMRLMAGETWYNERSRFIDEIPAELLESSEAMLDAAVTFGSDFSTKYDDVSTQEYSPVDIPKFNTGDEVVHSKWGRGKVLNVIGTDDDQTLDIKFLRVRKTIMPKYAKVEKV